MKLLFRIVYILLSALLIVYISFPAIDFPEPPEGAVQSFEPADTETPLRRAYFLNQTREEVLDHYKNQFNNWPTINLNYPPEEAQTIIRDQTRSSYLEELVHPFRESLYVNGFVPKEKKDDIIVDGETYYQKITIRYVPSLVLVRLVYAISASIFGYIVLVNLFGFISALINWAFKIIKKR